MKNKLVPALLIGAAVGVAVSLFDKNTRSSVVESSKDLSYYAKNPKEVQNKFQSSSNEPSKIDSIKDEVLFWKDTIEEIRRKNPELEQSIMDAKDTFMKNRNQKKLN